MKYFLAQNRDNMSIWSLVSLTPSAQTEFSLNLWKFSQRWGKNTRISELMKKWGEIFTKAHFLKLKSGQKQKSAVFENFSQFQIFTTVVNFWLFYNRCKSPSPAISSYNRCKFFIACYCRPKNGRWKSNPRVLACNPAC